MIRFRIIEEPRLTFADTIREWKNDVTKNIIDIQFEKHYTDKRFIAYITWTDV